MPLPTKPINARTKMEMYRFLLHGRTGIGKTTFCNHAKNNLFVAGEDGTRGLNNIYKMPEVGIVESWTEFREINALIAEGNHNFQAITYDPLENFYYLCQDHVCAELGIKHPSELDWGAGYTAVNDEFKRVINKICSLPYGVFFIAHSKEVEIKSDYGKNYTRAIPHLPTTPGKYVEGIVDITLFLTLDEIGGEIQHVIKTDASNLYEAKFRITDEKRMIVFPDTLLLDYNNFKQKFENHLVECKNADDKLLESKSINNIAGDVKEIMSTAKEVSEAEEGAPEAELSKE